MPWLIRRFFDEDAEFLIVPAQEVLTVAGHGGAITYVIPGAELGHLDNRRSFESVMLGDDLGGDAALTRLARIVHAADIGADIDSVPAPRSGVRGPSHSAPRSSTAGMTRRRPGLSLDG